MNARIYDPTIARFMSADSIIPYMYDTQAFNRYSYVKNNPLKYTDPSGHSWLSKKWKKVKNWVKENWRKIVGAALIVVGAIGLTPVGLPLGGMYWGPALMSYGASMIKYQPDEPEGPNNEIRVDYGGSSGTPEFTVAEWGGESNRQEQEQVNYLVTQASNGISSSTTSNTFANGANTSTFRVTVGNYDNVNSSGAGSNVLGIDRVKNMNNNSINYTSRIIGGIGGFLQIATGAMLCSSGYGCLLGVPLIAHGANNIEEAYYGNGHRGVLRSAVYDNAFGSNSNYAYAVGDIGLSASSMLRQVGVKSSQYWSRNFGNLERTRPMYSYQTSRAATYFEVVNNGNTIYNTEGN